MSCIISTFKLERLSNFVEIQPGFAFKSEKFVNDNEQVPLVKGENVQQGYIDWKASKYWPIEEYNNFEKYHLIDGDVVLAMDRPWVTSGLKWSYIKKNDPKSLLVQRVARLRARSGLNQTYLRCLISCEYFSKYIQPIVTGVNVPHISGKQIGDFKIPLPEINTQKKIATILSAYDNLIENNKRRIAILENMAEDIYKEWFVRFRFPGYEDAEFVKGIPKGWEIKTLDSSNFQILDGDRGKSYPRKEEFHEEGYCLFLNTGNLKGDRFDYSQCDFIDEAKDNQLRKGRVIKDDIVLTTRGSIGNIAYLGINSPYENVRINSGMIIIRTNEKISNSMFSYHLLKSKSMLENYKMFSSGSAQPQLPIRDLNKIKILYPETKLIDEYESFVKPMIDNSDLLSLQNLRLEKIKNSLLPRLISGKLSVEDLKIQLPLNLL